MQPLKKTLRSNNITIPHFHVTVIHRICIYRDFEAFGTNLKNRIFKILFPKITQTFPKTPLNWKPF